MKLDKETGEIKCREWPLANHTMLGTNTLLRNRWRLVRIPLI